MTGYRRFVAYVYEYCKGKKGANCGFVKLEAKDKRCIMEFRLQCRGVASGTDCRVYGFVRSEGLLEGVLLGTCKTGEDQVSGLLETAADNMGNSGIELEKIGGMVFVTDLGAFFGTEWDDQPIRPDDFREMPPKALIIEEPEGKESEAEEPKTEEPKTELEAEEIQSREEAPEECTLFEEGDFGQCRKIHPRDLVEITPRANELRNNRFLMYGYRSFGHLLLCRKDTGQYIVGVPGGYSQQERFMAGMFGFPYFKESREIELPQGKGGYWYRFLGEQP